MITQAQVTESLVPAVEEKMRHYARGLVRYDALRRRVWVRDQRLHHGAPGAIAAGLGIAGLAARRFTPRGGLEWALLGSVLMAHDWHDRSVWFQRGSQENKPSSL
jgi:hypothetical protein